MPNNHQQAEQPVALSFVFFVYIIESPSAPDLYHGRSEGALLASALRLDGIPCVTRTAINREAFVAALRIGLPEAMKLFQGRHPILHISAHGASQGIQLSDGDIVAWADLQQLLTPVNGSLGGALLLCMSSCKGYSACRMAMQAEADAAYPYFAMVGNFGEPTWSDTTVSYLTFYHLLAKGHTIPGAVAAMNAASGLDSWTAEAAIETRRGYIEFLQERSHVAEAQRELETVAEAANLPAEAKALEQRSGG